MNATAPQKRTSAIRASPGSARSADGRRGLVSQKIRRGGELDRRDPGPSGEGEIVPDTLHQCLFVGSTSDKRSQRRLEGRRMEGEVEQGVILALHLPRQPNH